MQLCAQWWLVITSPSGETNEPEQPPASRTEESCASESHFASGLKPCFFGTFALGKLSNVHIPSSARAASGSAAARQKAANRFMSAPGSAAAERQDSLRARGFCPQDGPPSRRMQSKSLVQLGISGRPASEPRRPVSWPV